MITKKSYLIKRSLLSELESHLDKKEISLLTGARQVGKTTLMKLIQNKLEMSGERVLFLNLDVESDKKHFVSQDALIRKVKLEIGDNEGFVFIDEIQRKEDAGLFLKGIYDLDLPYKFIVSGSGSLELKEKIHESLAGRKRVFELNPVSFEEFIDYKTGYKYGNLYDFFEVESAHAATLLKEYLNFGGYPRIILETTLEEKIRIINEIFQSYLEKDIYLLLKIDKTSEFSDLIKLLASQSGQLINYSKLCSSLNISFQTLKNYLYYIEKTFMIKRINPYYKNTKKEIVKSKIYYFNDLGIKNYSLGLMGNVYDFGFNFENLIFNILTNKLKYTSSGIKFWRTKDKAEVDFIIDFGNRVIPVEVKYRSIKKVEIGRSLRSFLKKYTPEKAIIVNLDFSESVKIESTQVEFIPYYRLTDIIQ